MTNIEKEFCLLHGELAELFEAYRRHLPSIGEEMADVAIYLLGLAEVMNTELEAGIDLGTEIERKMEINEHREYVQIDGVNTRISDV